MGTYRNLVDFPIEHGDFPVRFLLTFTRPGHFWKENKRCGDAAGSAVTVQLLGR